MNKYPAKPLMDEMAKHGRYGDSMLVHMHPAEVAGLASLVPGGRLPRNPVTGQPEAFYFLLPMLMNAAGASLTALQAAAVTGAASAIGNKDLGKGLLDGITAGATAGIGDAISGALDAGTNAVTQGVTEGASQAATEVGAQTAQELASQIPQIPVAGDIIEGTVLPELPAGTITNINPSAVPGASGIELDLSNLKLRPENISAQGVEFGKQGTDITKMTPSQFTERVSNNMNTGTIQDILQKPPEPNLSFSQRLDKGIKGIGTMGQLGIAGVAQGTKGDMEMREEARRRGEAFRAEGEAVRKEAFDNLQAGYIASGVPTGLSPARSEMSRYQQPPMYAAGGGQVRGMEEGGVTNENPYANQYSGLGVARDIARFMGGPRGYMGVDPVNVQQRLRGQDVVAPPRDYMPGFEPEFQYFQNLTRDPDGNIVGTPDVPDRGYRPLRQGVISRGQYFDPILQAPQSSAQMNEFRRTLEKLDPGPLGEAAVMGLASEGSVLSPMQQNAFEQYAPLAPFNTAQRGRISELMNRGMSVSQAIGNQESSRSKGYDLNGDGVVTDAEFTQATAEPETPDVPDYAKDMPPEQQAMLAEYMEQYGPETGKFLTSLMTGGIGGLFNYMSAGGESEGKKMPEVGPAPEPRVGPSPTGEDIPIRTSMMEGTVPDGGIARVPTEFTQQGDPMKAEVDTDLAALKAVVRGDIDNPELKDQIIEAFITKYGQQAYELAREAFLSGLPQGSMAMMSMGGAAPQTEGLLQGPGSGMDDKIPGMIGSSQPVAVSPGEYIVAADVVSGLGEGSSDAGAEELDKMMDRVRMARNGTTEQAPRISERKVMPA
jgi:hypothetical protein